MAVAGAQVAAGMDWALRLKSGLRTSQAAGRNRQTPPGWKPHSLIATPETESLEADMSWKRSLVHVALAFSVGGNVWMLHRVATLEVSLSALTARPRLEIGSRLPDLDLRTAEGTVFRVHYGDTQQPTILYIQSSSCVWCIKNADSVAALSASIGDRAHWIGISLDEAPNVDPEKPAPLGLESSPFPVYWGLSDTAAKGIRLRSTPTTIVVSSSGIVEAAWEGAYTGPTKDRIEAFFHVALPDLPRQ